MFNKIKNGIDKELPRFMKETNRAYSLSKLSPLLYKNIDRFIRSKGKRARPVLFVIGYLGFAKKEVPGLYTSALSLELLHDFMLVHDDIIDKSDTRRGSPSMHASLNKYLESIKNIKFSGQDLAIVVGDIMYAIGLHAFLKVKENPLHKEKAMKRLIEAAIYTGSGEFLELIYGIKDIAKITKDDIYKVYDLKTAHYTFASPLVIGSTLAGASIAEVNKLFRYGACLGRAFQIKDDILGMFGREKEIGKSTLTDLKEAKKTILVWQAYRNSANIEREIIKNILTKKTVTRGDLQTMRRIVKESGALNYAQNQIWVLLKKANLILRSSHMAALYKGTLNEYSQGLLKV